MAVHSYRVEYGVLPKGDAAAIMKALLGDSPHKFVFFAGSADRFGADGAFLDPWGTPYPFDLTEAGGICVYSSDPNLTDEHGTAESDDIVATPAKDR